MKNFDILLLTNEFIWFSNETREKKNVTRREKKDHVYESVSVRVK